VPKRFEYAVTVAGDGPVRCEDDWTPEHLVLAGLGRCTLKSLAFHAEQAGLSARGTAAAQGAVEKRPEDGRYAFVEVECGLDVGLDPAPEDARLRKLLELAERDCFVGASLTAEPLYEWRVNGEVVASTPT
jgi:organic hydroperoxide reductase OsmC/OhrA